jgi:hypothetical protein
MPGEWTSQYERSQSLLKRYSSISATPSSKHHRVQSSLRYFPFDLRLVRGSKSRQGRHLVARRIFIHTVAKYMATASTDKAPVKDTLIHKLHGLYEDEQAQTARAFYRPQDNCRGLDESIRVSRFFGDLSRGRDTENHWR